MIKFIVLVFLINIYLSYSQSDTLVINLKSGKSENISLDKIVKLNFETYSNIEEINNTTSNLKNNYPNPFDKITNIEFYLPYEKIASINIYSESGELINILACDNCKTGLNRIIWNGTNSINENVKSGIYFYELLFDKFKDVKKMIYLK